MPKAARTSESVQPRPGPSMMPNSSENRATIDSAAPGRSSLPWFGSRDVGDEEGAEHQRRDADGDVHPEHRAPREVTQQDPADHRADGHGETGAAGPDGDRPTALAWVAEHVGEDRQGRRHDQGAADAHERPAGDQVQGRIGERRRGRTQAEQDDADLQCALAAEAVRQRAGGEEQPGEHERVGVDDPLDVGVRGLQVGHQRRDRHVEDRVVHHDDHQRHAQHGEDDPTAAVAAVDVDGERRLGGGSESHGFMSISIRDCSVS